MAVNLKANPLLAVALYLTAGCASNAIERVRDGSTHLAEDAALVAFSVASNSAFPVRRLELLAAGDPSHRSSPEHLSMYALGDGEKLYLYRVPPGQVQFGSVRFLAHGGWWETQENGPEFTASTGHVTYLGRIRLYSVQYGSYVDSGRRFPSGARILLQDAGEEDLAQLATAFAIPPEVPTQEAVPDSWGDADYSPLRYRPIPGRDRNIPTFGPVGPPLPPSSTARP